MFVILFQVLICFLDGVVYCELRNFFLVTSWILIIQGKIEQDFSPTSLNYEKKTIFSANYVRFKIFFFL